MALFVEKRKDKKSSRIFPLAVIEGEVLGMTIKVEAPTEFKKEYPFVMAVYFQELAGGLAGSAMMLPEGSEEKMNIALDLIAHGANIGQVIIDAGKRS